MEALLANPVLPVEEVDGAEQEDVIKIKVLRSIEELAPMIRPEVQYCSSNHLAKVLASLAQVSHNVHQEAFANVLTYVKAMKAAKMVKPIMLLHSQKYDETPLRIRVTFPSDPNSGSDSQIAKLFVVEGSWTMVLARSDVPEPESVQEGLGKKFLLLRGDAPPTLRCGSSATAQSIRAILATAWEPGEEARAVFDHSVRLTQTDEFAANRAAERMRHDSVREEGPSWTHLPSYCAAHKVHGATQKTLSLCAARIKGVARTLLVCQMAGWLDLWRRRLKAYVFEHVKLVAVRPLTEEATAFRAQIMKLFFEKCGSQHAKILVAALSHVLNGDWRRQPLIHMCGGCCQDPRDCASKILDLLLQLSKTLKPRILNRSNWMRWHEGMNFLGAFMGIHNIFVPIFKDMLLAPGGAQEVEQAEPAVGHDDDEMVELRKTVAENKRVAMEWVNGDPLESVMLIRSALDPTIALMKALLKRCSPNFHIDQCSHQLNGQTRDYAVLSLAEGELVDTFIHQASEQLQAPSTWMAMARTESSCNETFRVAMRSVGTVFLLLACSWSRYPWRLFLVLKVPLGEAIARDTLETMSLAFKKGGRHDSHAKCGVRSPSRRWERQADPEAVGILSPGVRY